jgi:hypothetical protein
LEPFLVVLAFEKLLEAALPCQQFAFVCDRLQISEGHISALSRDHGEDARGKIFQSLCQIVAHARSIYTGQLIQTLFKPRKIILVCCHSLSYGIERELRKKG